MIKPSDVLRQIIRRLPFETARFCKPITATNARIIDGYLQFNASIPTADKYVVITGLTMLNPVTNAKASQATITLTLQNPHKLFNSEQPQQVTTDKGVFTLHRVVDGHTIELVTTDTSITKVMERLTVAAGYQPIYSNVNGLIKVKMQGEYSYPSDVTANIYSQRLNVVVTTTTKRMVDHYASLPANSGGLWAYIVFDDRNTLSKPEADAGQITTAKGVEDETLKISTAFDVFVWWATQSEQENARQQADEAYSTIYNAFNRCFFGHISDETGAGGFQCVPAGSGMAEAETLSNYIHRYSFLAVETIRYCDEGQRQEIDYFAEVVNRVNMGLFIQSGNDAPQPMSINLDNLRG